MISAEDEKLLKDINAEPVKVFLSAALLAKSKGDGYNYNHIVHQLRVRDDQEMVASVFVGLASCVSQFTQRPDLYRDLIQSVFLYDWKCERIVTVAFVNLLSHIISSNVTFLLPILQMLVRSFATFVPPAPVNQAQQDSASQVALLLAAQIAKDEKLQRIHHTLQEIIALVPTGLSELFPVMANLFPHKRFSEVVQRDYVTQLLHVCTYFPMIQERILDLIISKCLEIDVEIVIEDSGEVKIEEEQLCDVDDVIFSTDDDNDNNGNNTTVNHLSQRVYNEGSQYIPSEVAEMADKLDVMLSLLVEFIQKEIKLNEEKNLSLTNSTKKNEKIEKLSGQLMRIFEEKILLTHRSKFVQFILFFFASKVDSFGSKFGNRLVKLFLDESAGHVKRQSAILYLASYSVRANFLSIPMISNILVDLLTWAETYVKRSGTEYVPLAVITPNNSNNSVFSFGKNGKSADSLIRVGEDEQNSDEKEEEEEEEVDEFGRKQTVITSAVSRHETFFSCVQAACYIMCFYGVEVANLQKNSRTTQRKWQKVLTSTLQPLRFCLQSVRVEFLRLAQQSNMLEETWWDSLPHDVLPHANRETVQSKRPAGGSTVNMGAGYNPLDSFFPYDPCLLRMLHQPIEQYYRVWRGVPGLDDVAEGEGGVEIEVECENVLGGNKIIEDETALEVSLCGGEEMARSRTSSMCSDSESESDVSRSVNSSMHHSFSQSRSMSVDVSLAMSMTESVGIGLLEEQEIERASEKARARSSDSRAHSMVSDCSLEDGQESPHPTRDSRFDPRLHPTTPHNLTYSQFGALIGLGSGVGVGTDCTDKGSREDGAVDSISQLADGGWPVPARRPRQYSVGSTGSW